LIGSLLNGFRKPLQHPLSFLPGLALIGFIFLVFFIVSEQYFDLLVNIAVLGQVPDTSFFGLPFQILFLYSFDIAVLFIASFVIAFAVVATNFFYANFASEALEKKPSLGEAFSKTLSEWKAALATVVFMFFLGALFGIVFWELFALASISLAVSLVLLALLALLVFFLLVKLVFFVPIMAIEKLSLRDALGKSWAFTNRGFLGFLLLIIFLLLVSIIASVVSSIGSSLADLVAIDFLNLLVFALFWAFSIAFSGSAIAFFYLKKGASANAR